MAKTLITWPHGSLDGERAAGALHRAYEDATTCVDPSALGTFHDEDHALLVVVGYRDEIEPPETLEALTECIERLGIEYVAIADCHADHLEGPWEPPQHLADATGAAVLSTVRELTFDELGTVFREGDLGISPVNPDGEKLWKEYRKGERESE